MNLKKAEEILDDLAITGEVFIGADDLDAIKLGKEASKAVRDARANNYWTPIPLLPGETEE